MTFGVLDTVQMGSEFLCPNIPLSLPSINIASGFGGKTKDFQALNSISPSQLTAANLSRLDFNDMRKKVLCSPNSTRNSRQPHSSYLSFSYLPRQLPFPKAYLTYAR